MKIPVTEKEKLAEISNRIKDFLVEASCTNCILGLHLSFNKGYSRFYLLIGGGEDCLEKVWKAFTARLPEYDTRRTEELRLKARRAVYSIRGAPQPALDPLKPLVEYFITSKAEGDYIALLKPRKPSLIAKILQGRRYKSTSRSALKEHHVEFLRKISEREIDYLSGRELERIEKRLERLTADRIFDTWVYVAGDSDNTAYKAALAVVGSLSPSDEKEAIKIEEVDAEKYREILSLKPVGKPSQLLPEEAIYYFWIPSIGVEAVYRGEFQLPLETSESIRLGRAVRYGKVLDRPVKISEQTLLKHVFVTGVTGSGKTNTVMNLLLQLYRLGIPFMVIEPVKAEYRKLLPLIEDLKIYTVGDENTSPFRLNPLEVEEGVPPLLHIDLFKAVFQASFTLYAPMPYS